MNQKELGAAVGLSFQMVQKYESGCYSVPASCLFAFAKVLNVPPSFFFAGPRLKAKDPVGMRETILLVRAYLRIRDPTVRESIAETIRAVARTSPTRRRGS
jgi:transcriptional regulator with XRE-family HTH domain